MSWSFSVSFRFNYFFCICCVCAFVSTLLSCSFSSSCLFNSSISLRPSFRLNSSFLFVISFLSFQLSPHISKKTWKNAVREKSNFFQVFKGGAIRAGICRPSSHLRPLAPAAATCGHSSGCKWLQVTANNANGCKQRCSGNFKSYQ